MARLLETSMPQDNLSHLRLLARIFWAVALLLHLAGLWPDASRAAGEWVVRAFNEHHPDSPGDQP